MKERAVGGEIKLVPYYPNADAALAWYQDRGLCMQVDNTDEPYTLERLNRMYDYLSAHGECYYIEYTGALVGDVSLRDSGEISIVVCREYQNLHIGRRCVLSMIDLAREKGFSEIWAQIYTFNSQSRKVFEAVGFNQTYDERFVYEIK